MSEAQADAPATTEPTSASKQEAALDQEIKDLQMQISLTDNDLVVKQTELDKLRESEKNTREQIASLRAAQKAFAETFIEHCQKYYDAESIPVIEENCDFFQLSEYILNFHAKLKEHAEEEETFAQEVTGKIEGYQEQIKKLEEDIAARKMSELSSLDSEIERLQAELDDIPETGSAVPELEEAINAKSEEADQLTIAIERARKTLATMERRKQRIAVKPDSSDSSSEEEKEAEQAVEVQLEEEVVEPVEQEEAANAAPPQAEEESEEAAPEEEEKGEPEETSEPIEEDKASEPSTEASSEQQSQEGQNKGGGKKKRRNRNRRRN